MALGTAEERHPVSVGPWRSGQPLYTRGTGRQGVWVAERDVNDPFWTAPENSDVLASIDEATAPFAGTAVMKLLGQLDAHHASGNRPKKTNRELDFAESQRIDHALGPPRHLVATLEVQDVLAGEKPTVETVLERIDGLSPEQRSRFGGCRAAIVMVRYVPLGYGRGVHDLCFFDRLALRLAPEESHSEIPEVRQAVDHWLTDERYGIATDTVPRAVLVHSLLEIARQVLLGLSEAATRFKEDRPDAYTRFLHRDIKPQNLFVDQWGNVRLGDFGHAIEADDSGHTSAEGIGTFYFETPEALTGELPLASRDERDDVWALGLTLATLWVTFLRAQHRSGAVPDYPHDLPLAGSEVQNQARRAELLLDDARHVELFTTMPRPLAAVIAAMLTTDRERRLARQQAAQLVDEVLSRGKAGDGTAALSREEISGVRLAAISSADEIVATAVATATATPRGRINLDEQLERAARGRSRLAAWSIEGAP